jgi:hypothetical protein
VPPHAARARLSTSAGSNRRPTDRLMVTSF